MIAKTPPQLVATLPCEMF